MNPKRIRVSLAQSASVPAPEALIKQLFDCLIHCSRKQQALLLNTLLRGCSASSLEQVRDEAVKVGALVEKKSRFQQQCNDSLLHSFFSFLNKRELCAVETVCSRWHYACTVNGVGWSAAL